MRNSHECEIKPSLRQGINIGKLLLPAYLRKGHLNFNDLLNVAIVTSHIDCQEVAEKIAVKILLNLDQEENQELTFEKKENYLNLLSRENHEEFYITMNSEISENEFTAALISDLDQFKNFKNEPDIGVGSGEDNIIKIAVKSLRTLENKEARKILSEILKQKLLKFGLDFERNVDWTHPRSLTPFQYGEDPNLIDEERSLENILDLSRNINEIRYDDFFMRQKRRLKRSIIYILDVSNTMFYDYEGINSINYSILSMIPLMWGLRKEKWGLTLFESNSHIIKDLYDDYNMEPILEDLILMITNTTTEMEKKFSGGKSSSNWGGTVPGKSIKWAFDQITDVNDRSDRMLFIFSDFVLSEPGKVTNEILENYRILERMKNLGVSICACVSPLAYKSLFHSYSKLTLEKLEQMEIFLANTYSPHNFLEQAQKFIDNI
jgi:hypothetical protein